MQQERAEILSLFKKSEELVDMLRKGRAFTEELMGENERLRYRVVQLEAERMNPSDMLVKEVERMKQALQVPASQTAVVSEALAEPLPVTEPPPKIPSSSSQNRRLHCIRILGQDNSSVGC